MFDIKRKKRTMGDVHLLGKMQMMRSYVPHSKVTTCPKKLLRLATNSEYPFFAV